MKPRGLKVSGMLGLLLASLLPVKSAIGADAAVVVLKGGTRIELKGPWVRQAGNALLTRSDGTLLSVSISEIDLKATAAAKKAVPPPDPAAVAPPQTPVEALRLGREGPRAKVRLTDADVSHETIQTQASTQAQGQGKAETAGKGAARLDVAGYDQSKSGPNVLLRGSLRNFGGTAASNARMSITALDENGDLIGTGEASLSKGSLEPFETVAFTAAVPVGDKIVAALRFSPQWIAAPPPASAAEIAAAAARPGGTVPSPGAAPGSAAANQPPPPAPTPFGLGVLYAAPAASSPSFPGASDPASQPKPPNQ